MQASPAGYLQTPPSRTSGGQHWAVLAAAWPRLAQQVLAPLLQLPEQQSVPVEHVSPSFWQHWADWQALEQQSAATPQVAPVPRQAWHWFGVVVAPLRHTSGAGD